MNKLVKKDAKATTNTDKKILDLVSKYEKEVQLGAIGLLTNAIGDANKTLKATKIDKFTKTYELYKLIGQSLEWFSNQGKTAFKEADIKVTKAEYCEIVHGYKATQMKLIMKVYAVGRPSVTAYLKAFKLDDTLSLDMKTLVKFAEQKKGR